MRILLYGGEKAEGKPLGTLVPSRVSPFASTPRISPPAKVGDTTLQSMGVILHQIRDKSYFKHVYTQRKFHRKGSGAEIYNKTRAICKVVNIVKNDPWRPCSFDSTLEKVKAYQSNTFSSHLFIIIWAFINYSACTPEHLIVERSSITMPSEVAITPAGITASIRGGNSKAQTRCLKPLVNSGSLDKFNHVDLTPVIGREFSGVQVTDFLEADQQLIDDLATTSKANLN